MTTPPVPFVLALLAAVPTAQPLTAQALTSQSLTAQSAEQKPTPADDLRAALAVQRAYAEVGRRVLPGVVTLRAYVRDERATAEAAAAASGPAPTGWVQPAANAENPYPGYSLQAACSGFVVAAEGEVLTVLSLLCGKDGRVPDLVDIETHDNARIVAEIVGSEPTVNLAIVQAMVFPDGHSRKLVPLPFGDSDALACGHQVLAFGDPAGGEKFCAVATFITLPDRDCYQDLLSGFYQQLATVAHGEAYGGPVVNLAGEVIGVLAPRHTTPGGAPAPKTGIEYALPSKIVVGLHESIRHARSFKSPWLGYSVMSRAEIAVQRGIEGYEALDKPRTGILIENVFQPSPAWLAGIQPGDFLVAFGNQRVFTPVDFQRAMYTTGIGKKAKLELYRAGKTLHCELLIEERPAEAAPR